MKVRDDSWSVTGTVVMDGETRRKLPKWKKKPKVKYVSRSFLLSELKIPKCLKCVLLGNFVPV